LQPVVVLGTDADVLKKFPLTIGQGILGNIALQRSGEIVNDARADPRGIALKGSRPDPMEYLMGIPVVSKNQLISLIAVWRSGEGQEFKRSELDFSMACPAGGRGNRECHLFENTRQRLLEIQAVYTFPAP
jgi:hypothetical protein